MNRIKSTVTIQDVAEAAGVSVSTVSRVLNDKDDVAAQTYDRVRRVIAELGYTSNLAARSMRSRKTNVIGLILSDVEHPFSFQVMRGVGRAIEQFGYDLILYTSGNPRAGGRAERERHYVSLLNGSITDGILVVTPIATTFSTAYPLVAIDPHSEGANFPAVIATNHAGALAAMEYLIELGHRRIGFISGRPDLQSAIRRFEGYQEALHQANIPLNPELIQNGDYKRNTAVACARNLLNRPDPPTAIFAANDESAIGVLEAARAAGVRVPEGLSVVGFDNIPDVAYLNPPLTTVDQFIDQMACLATEMLIDLIRGKTLEQDLRKVPTKLVVRDSCKAISN